MSVPGAARTLVLLRRVHDKHLAQGFGRVCQTLLGLSFKAAGFEVTPNRIGVPDILARRPGIAGGFAVEVKTSEERRIVLQARELEGLVNSGLTPTLAALCFPDPNPQWYLVDSRGLSAGTFDIDRLALRPSVDVGFDVNMTFRTILGERIDTIMENVEELDSLLKDEH